MSSPHDTQQEIQGLDSLGCYFLLGPPKSSSNTNGLLRYWTANEEGAERDGRRDMMGRRTQRDEDEFLTSDCAVLGVLELVIFDLVPELPSEAVRSDGFRLMGRRDERGPRQNGEDNEDGEGMEFDVCPEN